MYLSLCHTSLDSLRLSVKVEHEAILLFRMLFVSEFLPCIINMIIKFNHNDFFFLIICHLLSLVIIFYYAHLAFSFKYFFTPFQFFLPFFWVGLFLVDFSLDSSLTFSLDLSMVDQLAKMKENKSVLYSEWYLMDQLDKHLVNRWVGY